MNLKERDAKISWIGLIRQAHMTTIKDLHYLAIDPGATNTGVAAFTENGVPLENKIVRGIDNFMDWLEELDPLPKQIILEEYRVRSMKRGNAMSTLPVVQVIGMIKRWARKNNVPVFMQQPQDMYIGLKFLGIAGAYPRGTHVPDNVSALAHGVYYLTKRHIFQVKVD